MLKLLFLYSPDYYLSFASILFKNINIILRPEDRDFSNDRMALRFAHAESLNSHLREVKGTLSECARSLIKQTRERIQLI